MIVVDAVHKRYQTDHGLGPWVLQDISFVIPPQTNVGLVGANGAGKSTLLNALTQSDVLAEDRLFRRPPLRDRGDADRHPQRRVRDRQEPADLAVAEKRNDLELLHRVDFGLIGCHVC